MGINEQKTVETKVCKLIQGDCLKVMKKLPDNSINLTLTDIPYNEINRSSNGLRSLDKKLADVMTFDLI